VADAAKPARPTPVPTGTTRPYWEGTKAHKLRLQRCRRDQTVMFYPRVVCTKCGHADLEWIDASGKGAIYSYTVVHRAPNEAFKDKAPYVVAIVELDEGVRMMSNVRGAPEDMKIGRRVKVAFEELDDKITLPVFELEG
jgi:uncharacterized OB-fold protein